MIVLLFTAAVAALYANFRRQRQDYNAFKSDANNPLATPVDPERHAAGLNFKNLFKGDRVIQKKLATGESPFSGVTRGNAPRAPNVFLEPVRGREISRLDWRKPSNAIFTTDEYHKAFKRMHQITYGTPRPLMRQLGLDVGYGHSAGKGMEMPILHGRAQKWLPTAPGQPVSPSFVTHPTDHNYLANQKDLSLWL